MNSFRSMALALAVVSAVWAGCAQEPASKVAFKVEDEESPSAQEGAAPAEAAAEGGTFKRFKVYTDKNSPDNHYAPSGWMGDWGDLKMDLAATDNPHSGSTSIKILYTAQKSKGAKWTGIYWQDPPNNWGGTKGGFDLSGAKKLVFWARGEKGGEKIEEFRVGGIPGEFADSDVASIGPVVLTTEWKQYEIDLRDKDLTSISGGFMWTANVEGNPQGFTIYLDDIAYE